MTHSGSFSECFEVSDERPLRQGDVFEWLNVSDDPWQRYGVIVTADCDIAHEKHQGIISYCPVIELEHYLASFYLPRRVQRKVTHYEHQLTDKVRKYQRENRPDFPQPCSQDMIVRWLQRDGPDVIVQRLRVTNENEVDSLRSLWQTYREFASVLDSGDFSEQLDLLTRRDSAESSLKAREKLMREISSLLANLPTDCFFIGQLAPGYHGGFVVYLRLIRELSETKIATIYPDLASAEVEAKRIAHLGPPYIYRLTQQVFNVFASIGLPTEYEESRASVVEQLEPKTQSLEGAECT